MEPGGGGGIRWWERHGVNWVLVIGGASLGWVTTRIAAADAGADPFRVSVHAISGALFLMAGLAAHYRHAANPVGVLMQAAGIGYFCEDLQLSPSPWVHTLGQFTAAASGGFLLHLALAFPTGRLDSRPERILSRAAYAIVVGTGLVDTLFVDLRRGWPQDPPNRLLIIHSPFLINLSHFVSHLLAVLISVGLVLILWRRWHFGTALLRRLLAPVLAVLLIGAVVTAVGTVLDYRAVHAPLLKVYDLCFAALPIAFLIGMTRLYLGRSAVGRLLIQLRGPMKPADLRDLLAATLGDPSLQVRIRAASGLDEGRDDVYPARWPAGAHPLAVTPIGLAEGRPAVLIHDRLLEEDQHVLTSVAAAAGLALEHAALTEQVARQLAEVAASRTRIVEAADAERRRIERNLHDGAQQTLVTTMIGVRLAQRRLAAWGPDAVAALGGVAEHLDTALAQIRELARGLHPAILTEDGLVAAVEALLERLPTDVEIDAGPVPRLPAAVESTGYYVVAEALTNALKHAEASRLAVRIGHTLDQLSIRVSDDGRGGADTARGSGLLGLRDRVEALGGRFTVDSGPGRGTAIEAVIDL